MRVVTLSVTCVPGSTGLQAWGVTLGPCLGVPPVPVGGTARVQPGRPHGSFQRSEPCLVLFSHFRASAWVVSRRSNLAGVETEAGGLMMLRQRTASPATGDPLFSKHTVSLPCSGVVSFFFNLFKLFRKMLLRLQNYCKESTGSSCIPYPHFPQFPQ